MKASQNILNELNDLAKKVASLRDEPAAWVYLAAYSEMWKKQTMKGLLHMNDQEFYSIEICKAFQKTNNGKIKQRLPRKIKCKDIIV